MGFDVYLGLSRHALFRSLWLGTVAVRMGIQVGVIALTWLTLKSTGSGTKIGLVLAMFAVGDMLASPVVGVLLDRFPRKLLLNLDNIVQGLVFVALALLFALHHLPFVLLLGLVLLAGALSPLAYLGRMILLPNLVEREDWEAANTVMQLNMNLVTLLGPALGGILVAVIGVTATLMVTAGCYAIYAVTLARIPGGRYIHETRDTKPGSWLADLTHGWSFLIHVPMLLMLVLVTLLFSLTYGPLEPALPIMVSRVFHRGPQTLGLLWSGFAAGAVLGTILWGRFRPDWSVRALVSGIIVAWGIFSGGIGLTHRVWVSLLLLAMGGLTYAPYNIIFSLWRQRLVPDAARGKVFGAISGVTGAGLPLGQAMGGFLIAAMGAPRTVEVGGLACVVLGCVVFLARSAWLTANQADQESA